DEVEVPKELTQLHE
ncbi:TPA: cyclic lactone autoinducer peptide, partial [Staphylococcus aureus]|nr:cyclic lactone autoinducer peptide [Staphylococcus aureus]